MKRIVLTALTLLSGVAGLSHTSVAEACGGCFHSSAESTPSVVTGHRMALSLSQQRTVLWDQVQYTGDPKDFAWVLPVGPGAVIEEASDAWFESLEAVSATHLASPTVVCDNGQSIQQNEGSGFACGGGTQPVADGANGTPGETHRVRDPGGVTVEHQGTVGPYETATLKADDPAALSSWLKAHSYVIPADITPVIDAYVKAKSEFIVLRLKPGAGVRQMTPVRVLTPGASPTLPLRMVAAGTGSEVAIVLYVIAEGRYRVQNFEQATIDYDANLTWDWATSKSNYSVLRDNVLKTGGFLTTFSKERGLTDQVIAQDGLTAEYTVNGGTGQGGTQFDNLADLYFAQAALNDSVASTCGSIGSDLRAVAPGTVVAATTPGVPPAKGTVAESAFACSGYSDLSTALVGMHPSDVWVTRLEAELPRAMLATDLTVGASATQTDESSWHAAEISIGSPCPAVTPAATPTDTKPASDGSCAASGAGKRSPLSSAATLGLAGLALAFAARRSRRKR